MLSDEDQILFDSTDDKLDKIWNKNLWRQKTKEWLILECHHLGTEETTQPFQMLFNL